MAAILCAPPRGPTLNRRSRPAYDVDVSEKEDIAARLREEVAGVAALRRRTVDDPEFGRALAALKGWQAARLSQTNSDLLVHPRYRPATEFFLSDLYGARDFGERDRELARVIPAMCKMLPAGALRTIAAAVRLDRLSESLDQSVADALGGRPVDDVSYGEAYRKAGRRDERDEQIALTREIGDALDELTRSKALRTALVLMRKPARAAGFGDLQDFLERGFDAFRQMAGAGVFLDTVIGRERAVMQRLFAAKSRPFDVERQPLPV